MMNKLVLADGPGFRGLFADFDTTLWSGILRMAEAMIAAAPFLVAGVFAAGILRGMVGADRTRRILGVGHWTGPLRAWALGVLLPICSLGALPLARELRRAGIPSGTVLSFVLVAPVLNPVSIIYGLSHIAPVTLLYFAVGTFVVSVGIGLVWNSVIADGRDAQPQRLESAPRSGVARLAVTGDTAARALVGPVFVDYGLALLAVGLLGAFLPHGVLQTGLTRDNPAAPLVMGLIAIPVYVTPTDVMMHFGHIVHDGYSLGAAFALIVLGAGANVGVANWLRRDYGVKPLLLFVSMLIGSTLVIGLTADRTIVHGNATMEDHTHAFDPFTRLPTVGGHSANFAWVWLQVKKDMRVDEAYGLGMLAAIVLSGIILRLLGDRISVDHLLTPADAPLVQPDRSKAWNPDLSPRQLVGAGVVCALGLASVGLYLFYPSPHNLIEEMNAIRVDAYDAIRAEDGDEAKRRLAQWRSQAEKLPTSVLIRRGAVSPSQREAVDEVLYNLDMLEDFTSAEQFHEAQTVIFHVEKVYHACRDEFRSRDSAEPSSASL